MSDKEILKEFRRQFINVQALMVATVSIIEIIGYLFFVYVGRANFSLNDDYLLYNVVLPILVNIMVHLAARVVLTTASVSANWKNITISYTTLISSVVVTIIHREFIITSCSFMFPMVLSTVFNNRALLKTTLSVSLGVFLILAALNYREATADATSNINLVIFFGFIFISYKFAEIAINFSEKSYALIAEQTSMNNELKDSMRRDAMTGLYNKKAFYPLLEEAMEVHHTKRKRVSLAVIDIDDFKHVNDTYGHECGDTVIIELSKIMLEHCPDYKVCRYGGEEFSILFVGKKEYEAACIVQDILDDFSTHRFPFTNDKYTFSCGIVEYDGLMTKESFFSEADHNMYKAKKRGKNAEIFSGEK